MQDLRIILIIIGAVAIAALLIHGLWTSQKGRQKPIREKPMGRMASEPADDSFDNDGIGKVRVVSSRKPATRDEEDDWQATPHFSAMNDDEDDDEPALGPAPVPPVQPVSDARQREQQYRQGEIDPLFDEPVAPVASAPTEPETPEEAVVEPVRESEPELAPVLRQVPKTWQDVYVINLMARPNQKLEGSSLMRALTGTGFRFGDMDIFHRHQTPAGQGEILFSLINMVKPGTFDPDAMVGFSTPGVSIFMQLPKPGMAKNHFNLMVQTAENLAEDLDALLFDAERSPLSPDYLAHCREQLRDYDSQAR